MLPPAAESFRLSATDWALRAGVALVFTVFALEKLIGTGWVSLFAQIGLGQQFRYVTGLAQLIGSLLLLAPRTARLGAALIAATMLGAMFVHLFVLDTGLAGAVVPTALLPLIVAAGWKGRGESSETSMLTLR